MDNQTGATEHHAVKCRAVRQAQDGAQTAPARILCILLMTALFLTGFTGFGSENNGAAGDVRYAINRRSHSSVLNQRHSSRRRSAWPLWCSWKI